MSSYVKLDDVIKSFCSELGDSGLGMYPTYYQYIYNWLEEVKDQRLGGVGGDFRMPVDSRRVYFPSNMAIKDVGIVVNGNLQVLLPNGNMLDLDDDCGSMEAPSTGIRTTHPTTWETNWHLPQRYCQERQSTTTDSDWRPSRGCSIGPVKAAGNQQ